MSAPAPGVGAAGLAGAVERWSDRLNPLLVKEVRQGLRARVFWVCFTALLATCLVIALVAWADVRSNPFAARGRQYFFAFFVGLALVQFFVIPYGAYRSLAREREDETWVLLLLTGLGPRRLLRGKVASALAQAALYASAVTPFMLLSYLLNGISLESVLATLGLAVAQVVFLVVCAVCAATLAEQRVLRGLVHLCVLGGLLFATGQGLTVAGLLGDGGRLLRDDAFAWGVGAWLWGCLSYAWLFYEAAAARLSLPTEDYAAGPRRAVVVQLALTLAGLTVAWWVERRSLGFPILGVVVGSVHLAVVGLLLSSDADGVARALRPRTRAWTLLRPGARRGFRLTVLLLVALALFGLGLGEATLRLGKRWGSDTAAVRGCLAAPAYVLLYLSVALLVCKLPRTDRLAAPAVVRAVFLVLVALGGTLPPVLALLAGLKGDDVVMNALNPFVGTVNFMDASSRDLGLSHVPGGGPLAVFTSMLGVLWALALTLAWAADRVLGDREARAHAA